MTALVRNRGNISLINPKTAIFVEKKSSVSGQTAPDLFFSLSVLGLIL